MNQMEYFDFRKHALEEVEEQFETENSNSRISRNTKQNNQTFSLLNKNGKEVPEENDHEGKSFEKTKSPPNGKLKFANLIKLIAQTSSITPVDSYRTLPQSNRNNNNK